MDTVVQMGARNTIHLSKLKTDCRWGDLILFKCANSMSRLQRSVTGSEWDHVGIVVRSHSFCSRSNVLKRLYLFRSVEIACLRILCSY